ncbi:L,D-transpeptidase family protein [Xinfangfangia sp. CPCC 101601]|uniref:L,D-transpeptidase family protein n=1 Tax=Pseudogemmobacter lacusdianii TaxID=3069608 RepID=A0ABU0VUT2_9RHOB|nr:L,D-transpeptidase family protein [Xinfangfangia sp. CPCC 101601]MDQ2065495.1 L,D-transpeptidase family protein [Xinfangfangia sp. CPCC 101601]
MMSFKRQASIMLRSVAPALLIAAMGGFSPMAAAQEMPKSFDIAGLDPFTQSLAAAAGTDTALADWYRLHNFAPIWTGENDAPRRAALLAALDTAADHGLPPARYDAAGLRHALQSARTEGDRGRIEAAMSRAYLTWAKDLTSGMLEPQKIDTTIVREIKIEDPAWLLTLISGEDPQKVLRDLVPTSDAYVQLMKEKLRLETLIANGGWGEPVAAKALKPGAMGPAVVQLRDRLVALGYLGRSATARYDPTIEAAVLAFQLAHGLPADGVAGPATITQINIDPAQRLQSVVVAMERERWLDIPRDGRMIWVNLPDYSTKILQDGQTVFMTRSVIGRQDMDRRTPEFSDEMAHMVVNPSWGVPRSITVGEYLPLMKNNPNAVSHLQVIDSRGRVVPRSAINFSAYTARSFPYSMRQPPGDANALGKVKFMFPNKYNIYLHDTPSKSLFKEDVRAYSHGCIRLADPFDFAHALFSTQSETAEEEFLAVLKTGKETTVRLDQKVPIHMVYFTAYPEGKGRIGYRRDVYDRDAKLWEALSSGGVALTPEEG